MFRFISFWYSPIDIYRATTTTTNVHTILLCNWIVKFRHKVNSNEARKKSAMKWREAMACPASPLTYLIHITPCTHTYSAKEWCVCSVPAREQSKWHLFSFTKKFVQSVCQKWLMTFGTTPETVILFLFIDNESDCWQQYSVHGGVS